MYERGMEEKKKLSIKEIGIKKLVIMLACGVGLLLLTFTGGNDTDNTLLEESGSQEEESEEGYVGEKELSVRMDEYIVNMEKKMEEKLVLVDGVGEVKVMITLKSSAEKIVLKDETSTEEIIDEKDSGGGTRNNESVSWGDESVIVDSVEGNGPFTIKETTPYIQGVVVVAAGGDNAKVRQEIIEAVQVLFDVEVHKIKVMKMSSD